jgi:hypothetical protein
VKLLADIDLQEADRNLETVVKYAQLSNDVCKNHEYTIWINFTDCVRIAHYTDRQIKKLEELKMLVRQFTRIEDKDQMIFKRGVLNFIGGMAAVHVHVEEASYNFVSNEEKSCGFVSLFFVLERRFTSFSK